MSTTLKSITLTPVFVFASGSTTSLANNANALSAEIDPTATTLGGSGTTPGYPRARFTFSTGTTALAAAPSGVPAVQLFFLTPADGTLTGTPGSWITDLGRSTTPVTPMGAAIPLDTTNTTQTYASLPVEIPAVPFKVILVNAGTGQTFPAGWSLTLTPVSEQGV